MWRSLSQVLLPPHHHYASLPFVHEQHREVRRHTHERQFQMEVQGILHVVQRPAVGKRCQEMQMDVAAARMENRMRAEEATVTARRSWLGPPREEVDVKRVSTWILAQLQP